MNSGLTNIWREIGAYLRYGDAKCIFLCGLGFSLLFSFARFELAAPSLGWDFLTELKCRSITGPAWVALISFGLSSLCSGLAVIPSLSTGSLRIKVLNALGRVFSFRRAQNSDSGAIFFWDIAKVSSVDSFKDLIKKNMNLDVELSPAEQELVSQIWVISQIASAKFIAANLAVTSIIIGSIFAFL